MKQIRKYALGAMLLVSIIGVQAQRGPGGPASPPPDPRVATQEEAAAAVQRAYDGIARVRVLGNGSSVAGLNVNTLIAESKSAYQEALSRYQANGYVGAREQAMASADLARASEELAMSTGVGASQAGVPAPPVAAANPEDSLRAMRDVQNLSYRLSAVGNTLNSASSIPAATASQAKSLLAMSQQLLQRAQSLLSQNQPEHAIRLARAGDALTHVAEHLENRYLIAAGIVPTPPSSSPGPDGVSPLPPGPDGPTPPPPQLQNDSTHEQDRRPRCRSCLFHPVANNFWEGGNQHVTIPDVTVCVRCWKKSRCWHSLTVLKCACRC